GAGTGFVRTHRRLRRGRRVSRRAVWRDVFAICRDASMAGFVRGRGVAMLGGAVVVAVVHVCLLVPCGEALHFASCRGVAVVGQGVAILIHEGLRWRLSESAEFREGKQEAACGGWANNTAGGRVLEGF